MAKMTPHHRHLIFGIIPTWFYRAAMLGGLTWGLSMIHPAVRMIYILYRDHEQQELIEARVQKLEVQGIANEKDHLLFKKDIVQLQQVSGLKSTFITQGSDPYNPQ